MIVTTLASDETGLGVQEFQSSPIFFVVDDGLFCHSNQLLAGSEDLRVDDDVLVEELSQAFQANLCELVTSIELLPRTCS